MSDLIIDKKSLAAWIRRELAAQDMSISELTRRLEAARPGVSRIVSGYVNPRLNVLLAIVDELGYELRVHKVPRNRSATRR